MGGVWNWVGEGVTVSSRRVAGERGLPPKESRVPMKAAVVLAGTHPSKRSSDFEKENPVD